MFKTRVAGYHVLIAFHPSHWSPLMTPSTATKFEPVVPFEPLAPLSPKRVLLPLLVIVGIVAAIGLASLSSTPAGSQGTTAVSSIPVRP